MRYWRMINRAMSAHITGEWLRETGWTYHAIGKYFYLRTSHDTLLIRGSSRNWQVSAVANHIDPQDYVDLEAVLFTDATRDDVMAQVRLCN